MLRVDAAVGNSWIAAGAWGADELVIGLNTALRRVREELATVSD